MGASRKPVVLSSEPEGQIAPIANFIRARQAVLAVDPTQPAADFATMSDVLGRSISPQRFNMLMLATFSGLALALAAIGVYGLTAYAVAQRTREIGIRVSLGASRPQLVRGLLGQGLGCVLQVRHWGSLGPSS
jgi:ABC-type antimicrobial peptide transport system permease subunit